MTTAVLPVFDLMSAEASEHASLDGSARLARMAEELVAGVLAAFRQVEQLDRLPPGSQEPFRKDVAIMLRLAYSQCAQDAEQVLQRVSRLEKRGKQIAGAEALRDALGRTQAMLSVSLEDISEAQQQGRQGNVRAAEELRRELRARLHQ